MHTKIPENDCGKPFESGSKRSSADVERPLSLTNSFDVTGHPNCSPQIT
jgi:hypothetical protein